jgi:hypothetical protein
MLRAACVIAGLVFVTPALAQSDVQCVFTLPDRNAIGWSWVGFGGPALHAQAFTLAGQTKDLSDKDEIWRVDHKNGMIIITDTTPNSVFKIVNTFLTIDRSADGLLIQLSYLYQGDKRVAEGGCTTDDGIRSGQ